VIRSSGGRGCANRRRGCLRTGSACHGSPRRREGAAARVKATRQIRVKLREFTAEINDMTEIIAELPNGWRIERETSTPA